MWKISKIVNFVGFYLSNPFSLFILFSSLIGLSCFRKVKWKMLFILCFLKYASKSLRPQSLNFPLLGYCCHQNHSIVCLHYQNFFSLLCIVYLHSRDFFSLLCIVCLHSRDFISLLCKFISLLCNFISLLCNFCLNHRKLFSLVIVLI